MTVILGARYGEVRGIPLLLSPQPYFYLASGMEGNPFHTDRLQLPQMVPPGRLLGVGLAGCLEIFEYKKIAEMTPRRQLYFPKKGTPRTMPFLNC